MLQPTHLPITHTHTEVRLDHMLKRLKVLQAAAVAQAPVKVTPNLPLYLGSASAADAHFVLRYLGITHILNATEEVIEPPPSAGFTVLRIPLRDVDEEDIQAHFHTAIAFISSVFGQQQGGSAVSQGAAAGAVGDDKAAGASGDDKASAGGSEQAKKPGDGKQGVLVHCR